LHQKASLADKIEIEPIGSGRQRAFKFRGALTIDRLIGGEAMVATDNTPKAPMRPCGPSIRSTARSSASGAGALRGSAST